MPQQLYQPVQQADEAGEEPRNAVDALSVIPAPRQLQPPEQQQRARPSLVWLLLCAALSSACTLLLRPLFAGETSDRLPADSHASAAASDASRDCLNGSYTEGEWQYDPEARYSYIGGDVHTGSCDHWGGADEGLILWNFNASELRLHNISFPIRPELLNSSSLYVRPAIKYVWRPTGCVLQPFPVREPLRFCRALQSRPLLFVGDSFSYEQYQALIFILGDVARDEQIRGGESRVCNALLDRDTLQKLTQRCEQGGTSLLLRTGETVELGSGCRDGRWRGGLPAALEASTPIRYRRNDHLSFVDADVWSSDRADVETPWHTALANDTVLVLNAGLHTEAETAYRQHISAALYHLQLHWPSVSVIWRSTTHGHAGCLQPLIAMPYTTRQYEALSRFKSVSDRNLSAWESEVIPRRNEIAAEELRQARLNRSSAMQQAPHAVGASHWQLPSGSVQMLDVLPFDRLRPDSHRPNDCLHHCLPGSVDTWNIVLYNMLIGRAS